jgi:DNA mismatch repair protein MutL
MNALTKVGKIQVLSEALIGKIAAGEVVERPAAVVKELIDNSLDAQSRFIVVDIEDGGRKLIRVTDDGEGMGQADALLAFQRHATSKLRSDDDLFAILTLGFRGEALPSIAAVSRVQVLTNDGSQDSGTRLSIEGGTVLRCEEAASPQGTQFEVRDLFFNTPARQKFLKSTATEFSHICQVVQQAALAAPSVHFRLSHQGQAVLEYPAALTLRDRALQVYRGRLIEQMVEVLAERPGVTVQGFTAHGMHVKSSRTPQEIFVNHRPIKNGTVSHAIYDAYGPYLAKGLHPFFVLFLTVDPQRIDVNVHPTKREVRFSDTEVIHSTVRQAVQDALKGSTQVAHPSFDAQLGFQHRAGAQTQSGWTPPTSVQEAVRTYFLSDGVDRAGAEGSTSLHAGVQGSLLSDDAATSSQRRVEVGVVPLGQIAQTYLVAQVGTELQIVDQHTAHERVLFERLLRARQRDTISVQPLLIPESFDLLPHEVPLLERFHDELAGLGLDIEHFGAGTFVLRSVPALIGALDYPALVRSILEDLTEHAQADALESRVRAVLATMACHGAVRAGRIMALPEIKQVVEDWIAEGLPMTCPHGRRVALRFPEHELAKVFARA